MKINEIHDSNGYLNPFVDSMNDDDLFNDAF